ncbi:MAG TPA: hypothetical protein VJB17_04125 [Patescibacteria group bacterium]|nr:hypothetical protein [Patescibacteria group bacterium]
MLGSLGLIPFIKRDKPGGNTPLHKFLAVALVVGAGLLVIYFISKI